MLFFEDEIQRARKATGPSGWQEMAAQDPRMNGVLRKEGLRQERERSAAIERRRRLLDR